MIRENTDPLSTRGRNALDKLGRTIGHAAGSDALFLANRLSENQLVALSNMWHERSAYIVRCMQDGLSYTAANRESREKAIYDTCDWREVTSRLRRGRGSVREVVSILTATRSVVLRSTEQRAAVATLADQLAESARALFRLVHGEDAPANCDADDLDRHRRSLRMKRPTPSSSRLIGKLRLCLAFLKKNVHDVPLIEGRTGFGPTTEERKTIGTELNDILRSSVLLASSCRADHQPPVA